MKSRVGVPSIVVVLAAIAAISVAAHPSRASGHDLGFTRTTLVLLPDGTVRLDMVVDLDALALGVPQNTDDEELVRILDGLSEEAFEEAVEGLRQTFLRRVRIRLDGEPLAPEVVFPQRGSEAARAVRTVLGLTARMTASLADGATELTVQASRAFPPLHLSIVDVRDGGVSIAEIDRRLAAAGMPDPGTPTDAPTTLDDIVTIREILERGARSTAYPLDRPAVAPTRLEVVRQYVALGFTHIVPRGADHILFVLGLFLLNSAWRPLLAQVTAFTAAHTMTLGLSTYGVVSLAPGIVEPLIAISIAWIAFENLMTADLKPWRPAIVFLFGLLHGLGFAGVLAELGLPRGEYLTALLSFNAGVELGQLAVIAAAAATLGWLSGKRWYRRRVTMPASAAIGLVGLVWSVQRLFAP